MTIRKLIGVSGPSSFTAEMLEMVEKFFNANFVLLYHNDKDNLKYWLKRCSGVILSGGVDIHPSAYGHNVTNHNNFGKFDIDRDIRELFLIENCIKDKIPMLGVCRGMQLLGVYHGMELFADITHGRIAHTPHRQDITLRNHEPSHAVRLLEKYKDYFNPDVPEERKFFVRESFKYDTDLIWVNSYHHQAIKYYGAKDQGRKWATDALSVIGIAATGVKDCEQIVELMCGKTAPWIGAQFHPEIDYNTNTPSRKVLERFGSFMDKYIETKVSVKK